MSTESRTTNEGTATESNPEATSHVADLTKFQLDVLTILAGESNYGLGIKAELEDYYGEEVNHGRLYPNLDDLVNKGLIEKSERDQRTNDYALTTQGRKAIRADAIWRTDRIDHDAPKLEGDD